MAPHTKGAFTRKMQTYICPGRGECPAKGPHDHTYAHTLLFCLIIPVIYVFYERKKGKVKIEF